MKQSIHRKERELAENSIYETGTKPPKTVNYLSTPQSIPAILDLSQSIVKGVLKDSRSHIIADATRFKIQIAFVPNKCAPAAPASRIKEKSLIPEL